MKCYFLAGLLVVNYSFAQNNNDSLGAGALVAIGSRGDIIEASEVIAAPIGRIPSLTEEGASMSPELKTTIGLDVSEDIAIRRLFYQAGITNGFTQSIDNESDRVLIMNAAVILDNDNSEIEELENYCVWLLDDEVSKTPEEVAFQFIAIGERSSARVLEVYRLLLPRLTSDSLDFIEAKKIEIHSSLKSQDLDVLAMLNINPDGFVSNWRENCRRRF